MRSRENGVHTVQTLQPNDTPQAAPAPLPGTTGAAKVNAAGGERPPSSRPSVAARVRRSLAFNRIGAVYVWLGIVVLFSIWVPDTFPTISTVKQVLNANAITLQMQHCTEESHHWLPQARGAATQVLPIEHRLQYTLHRTLSGVTISP